MTLKIHVNNNSDIYNNNVVIDVILVSLLISVKGYHTL